MVMRWLAAGRLEGDVRGLGIPACDSDDGSSGMQVAEAL